MSPPLAPPSPVEVAARLARWAQDTGRDAAAWWPAKGPDPRIERTIGAVLVQQTRWLQAARALDQLRDAGLLDLQRLADAPAREVAAHIRPAGFATRKTATLVALAGALRDEGGFDVLAAQAADDPDPVRRLLLEVPGIGPETADAILAYALEMPIFVVDAYARRLMHRLGVDLPDDPRRADYHEVQAWWRPVPAREGARQRLHALIVMHGQDVCRSTPLCPACPLEPVCAQRIDTT